MSPADPVKSKYKRLIPRLGAALFWLAAWQGLSMLIGQEILLVSPVVAMRTLWRLMGTADFYRAVLSSFGRILLGFALATAAGVALSVLSGVFSPVKTLVEPLMHVIKATPVASFVILALIFIRARNLSVFISFLMVLPIMYTNLTAGIAAADPRLLQMAKVFRLSPLRTAFSVRLIAVYPYFLSACSLSLGMCWKAGVAAEVIGLPDKSIGEALYRAKLYFATPEVYAWTLAIILLSLAFEKGVLALTRRLGAAFAAQSEERGVE